MSLIHVFPYFFCFSIYADLVDQSGSFGSFGTSSKDQKKSKYFSDYKSESRSDRGEVNIFILLFYLFKNLE